MDYRKRYFDDEELDLDPSKHIDHLRHEKVVRGLSI